MNRQQVWKVVDMAVGVVLLVCGLQLYGQQPESGREAAAKAGSFTTFDAHATAAQQSGGPRTGAPRQFGVTPRGQSPAGKVNGSVDDTKRDVRYTVTQIGVLPNEQSSFLPIGGTINNGGVVAGYSYSGAFGASNDFYLTAVAFIG